MSGKRLTRETSKKHKKRKRDSSSRDSSRSPVISKRKRPEFQQRDRAISTSSEEEQQPRSSHQEPALHETPPTAPITAPSSSQNEPAQSMHDSAAFKNYLAQVRSKSIPGVWKRMDYEMVAENTRYTKVATWLRKEKPELDQLMYNGAPSGLYKCKKCEERGNLHIIKACHWKKIDQFKSQNIERHFETKAHLEIVRSGPKLNFSAQWRKEMYVQYLKLMGSQRVSGAIFKSNEFVEIIASWINQATNARVDTETVMNEMPDRRTLQRKLQEMEKECTG